jgi:transcriptional regulator with XRE-family HTH domain
MHGLTQEKLAGLLKVDESTIRYWERDKHKPSKKLLKIITRFLKI